MDKHPNTLGEALTAYAGAAAPRRGQKVILGIFTALNIVLITALTTLPVWWVTSTPKTETFVAVALAICALWALLTVQRRRVRPYARLHPLLAHDQHGFMKDLKLGQKTVIFDGNNLYHFGLKEGLGPRALSLIAKQLRAEAYRVVCFFDANIHYTLIEHGDAPSGERHSVATLQRCFGLKHEEIYVVPSGTQADRFILDSLKYLPISFTVTNDQFREYRDAYRDVMKGDQWRKGVRVVKNEIRVIKHRFKTPVYVN